MKCSVLRSRATGEVVGSLCGPSGPIVVTSDSHEWCAIGVGVFARIGGDWFEGRVVSVKGTVAGVRLDDGSFSMVKFRDLMDSGE